MDENQTFDEDYTKPRHPISIHDMDIEAAVPLAAIWWRSERYEWPLARALLVWLVYEADPPTIYSADNPADVNTFDKLFDKVLEYSKRLYLVRCPRHGVLNVGIIGLMDGAIAFRCRFHHNWRETIEFVSQNRELDNGT